jgi:radical SAM protein with 4Fe4S-binding SPASM domain
MLPYIWDVIEIVYEYQSKLPIHKRAGYLSIPTNLSFLKGPNKEFINKIKELKERFSKIGIRVSLSGSFDGPFMDFLNRPHRSKNRKYNEDFYHNFIKYCHELELGSHPMVYSNNIEHWIDNFVWYRNQSPTSLYLLEVRNIEWTPEQCLQLFYLMRFTLNFLYKRCQDLGLDFIEEFKLSRGFNLLSQPFSIVGRGLGCSIQSTLNIYMHNLNLVPCHRTSYKRYVTGKFAFNEDGTYDFEPENVEQYLAEQATHITRVAPCTGCPIMEICGGTCLGSNYEATGDFYTVPPSFCRATHAKYAGTLKGFEDIGLLHFFYDNASIRRKSEMKFLLSLFEDL